MSSKSLYTITLKGVSQVMLQENIYTGLLFFIAIFYVNQIASLYMLLATFLATYFAFEISLDENSLNSGIYGFNAALVGVAVELFFGVSFFSITLLIFGSVLTVLIQEYFRKNSFSLFVLPFILVVWLFLWLFSSFVTLENSLITDENLELFSMVFKGFSEVFFQDSIITGILFFIAIYISNKKASFFALFFSILASIIAYLLDFDLYSINMGLFAYNTVLCAIVFANFEKNSYIFALFSTIFALIIQIIFIKLSFIALTFPFVLASIVLLKFYKN